MGRKLASYFKMGDWNATCDYCGATFKASQLQKDWKGFMACARDWDPRHPQDFVRGVPDNMTPPWTRPRPAPIFTLASVVNPGTGGVIPSVPPGTGSGNSLSIEGISGGAIAGNAGADGLSGEAVAGISTVA